MEPLARILASVQQDIIMEIIHGRDENMPMLCVRCINEYTTENCCEHEVFIA